MRVRWAIKWRSSNRLDGDSQHIMCGHAGLPIVFRTKREAQTYIRRQYGYIARRPDLKAEPHGWKMPIPVRVEICVKELAR